MWPSSFYTGKSEDSYSVCTWKNKIFLQLMWSSSFTTGIWRDMKVKYRKVSQFLLWLLTVDPAPQHISRSGHVWSRNAKSLSVPATSGQPCSFAIKQNTNANIKNYLWIHHCSSSQSHTHMTHIQATKIRHKIEIYRPTAMHCFF